LNHRVTTLKVPIDAGKGPPVVLLHGFAMLPRTYEGLVRLLEPHCRVVVPDLFDLRSKWSYPEVLDSFASILDKLELDSVTMIGHSFGGGIELGFAVRWPGRVTELVFSDTLAVSREWRLAAEAFSHPQGVVRLASRKSVGAFAWNWLRHPRQLVDAALWAFTSDREYDARGCAQAGIRSHVLWANRDSILSRGDGVKFADELEASFTVAFAPDRRAVDHDWMFEQPELFYEHLLELKLDALSGASQKAADLDARHGAPGIPVGAQREDLE
jgi:pimeloyl-ACP methyl ester carboxylesterase